MRRAAALLLSAAALPSGALGRNNMSRTPPMGWMSWEIFRCHTDCEREPDSCISERLYRSQADALVSGGYLSAGYTGIHMDDCWENKPRDPADGRLVGNHTRFPSGMKALGDYYHSKGAKFGLYTAESPTTCGGYPGSAKHEDVDAKTFAEWGVDYLKVDGCGMRSYYPEGYKAMGAALEASGRDIEYSCSWPAYLGTNETKKPFQTFIDDGCNGWRNYHDIQCNWGSLSSIIDQWGYYGKLLQRYAGHGHWHDMDMLIIGNGCITEDEERTQMAIWAISASPLIMGNDMRSVPEASKAILLNQDAIAVSQDPLGKMGIWVSGDNATQVLGGETQVWARHLADGSVAVALYNKGNPHHSAPSGEGADITVQFADVTGGSRAGPVVMEVRDIWAGKELGAFTASYTAKRVPHHGTAFLRLRNHK